LLPTIEVGEGDEKLGQRAALAAEKIAEAGGFFTGGGHACIVARVFEVS
jgi:hypothetical protein